MPGHSHTGDVIDASDRFESKVDRNGPGGCWLWTAYVTRKGYGEFRFNGSARRAHRVSWEMHYGPIPDGLSVLHRCDVPGCVNPNHLFLGTISDNQRDMARKGRSTKGERNARAKLTIEDVIEIRALANKFPPDQIAACFNISRATIGDIISRRSWRHVQ